MIKILLVSCLKMINLFKGFIKLFAILHKILFKKCELIVWFQLDIPNI